MFFMLAITVTSHTTQYTSFGNRTNPCVAV